MPLLAAALTAGALAAFAAALLLRDLVQSVIAFALGTAAFAGLLGTLGAPLVGALEVIVGIGLASILFLIAIALTSGRAEPGVARATRIAAPLVFAGAALLFATLPQTAGAPATPAGWIGPALWGTRGLDVAAQALVLLAAVLGVLAVVGEEGPA